MYYSTREEDVWEAFTSSPLQPLELQLTMLRWAEQQNNFNMAARLYQWLDYHNLARESRMLTNGTVVTFSGFLTFSILSSYFGLCRENG